MSGRKDETLGKLSDEDLLELANSVSGRPVGRVSRSYLAKIVKDALSIVEIEKRIEELRDSRKKMEIENQPKTTGMFYSGRLLKVSIIIVFASFVLTQLVQWYYQSQSNYIRSLAVDYQVQAAMLNSLYQLSFALTTIVNIVRVVGLALLTFWIFLSALRASAVGHTSAAILALAGSILIAGILISFLTVTNYYVPYF